MEHERNEVNQFILDMTAWEKKIQRKFGNSCSFNLLYRTNKYSTQQSTVPKLKSSKVKVTELQKVELLCQWRECFVHTSHCFVASSFLAKKLKFTKIYFSKAGIC